MTTMFSALLDKITYRFCRNRMNVLFTEPWYIKKKKAWPLFLLHLFYEEGLAESQLKAKVSGCASQPGKEISQG